MFCFLFYRFFLENEKNTVFLSNISILNCNQFHFGHHSVNVFLSGFVEEILGKDISGKRA